MRLVLNNMNVLLDWCPDIWLLTTMSPNSVPKLDERPDIITVKLSVALFAQEFGDWQT